MSGISTPDTDIMYEAAVRNQHFFTFHAISCSTHVTSCENGGFLMTNRNTLIVCTAIAVSTAITAYALLVSARATQRVEIAAQIAASASIYSANRIEQCRPGINI